MKIGIDGRLWYESGVGRYIRNLVLGLEKIKTNHEFVIFLNTKAFTEVNFKSPNFRKIKADSPWHTLNEQISFKKIIEKENIDLMHFPYFSYPVFYRKPFVITIHDLIIDHFPTGKASSLPFPFYNFKRLVYKQITKRAVKNAKKIIVPSNATLTELVNLYRVDRKKAEVIYEGFDSLISNKKTAKDLVSDNYILYVGNAHPHKNLKNLINAYMELRKTENIDLIFIGKKDFFYENLENKIYEGVYFLHNVDDGQLFDYYTNAKCLVAPSKMEGFGLPLLEGMSLSCTVVSSNTKAFKEIGGDACLYFDPENYLDLCDAIKKVINDKSLRSSLIQKGIAQSKKYSWEKCINETLKLYESCDSLRQSK